MRHIRPLLVALVGAAAMLGLVHEAARPGQAQSQPTSSVGSIVTVNAAPAWVQTFKDGGDGVFDANGMKLPNEATSTNSTLQTGGDGYFVGVLKKDPWRLDRCDGLLLGNVFMNDVLAGEVETVYNEGFRHQVLLGRLGDNGFDIQLDSLEDVRAGARNGYCGEAPPNRHFDEGTLDHDPKQWRADVFELWPWFSQRRIFVIETYVNRLANLFAAHLDYDTQLQGEYEAGSIQTRGKMWTLDRFVFVQPHCCGRKVSTLWFPFADTGRRPLVFLPYVRRAPSTGNQFGTPMPSSTPGGPATATEVPDVPTPAQPTPTPIVVNTNTADTNLDPTILTQAAEWTAAQQQAGAPLVAQLVGYNGGISLCGLRAVGTEDGGGVITDTQRIQLEGQWGDRLHGMTKDGSVRLSYPSNVSPGRPAFRPCSMAAATNSNNLYDVILVVQTGETYRIWFGDNSMRQVLMNGAIVAGERQGNTYVLWFATGGKGWPWLVAGDNFGLSKVKIDVTDRTRPIVTEEAFFPTLSAVYVAGLNQAGDRIHAIEYDGVLHTLDLDLKETAQAIRLPQVLRPEAFEFRLQVYRGVLHQMSLSQDDKHVVMGSGRNNKLIVADLESRSAWLADAPNAGDGFYIGVAFNPYDGVPLHQLAAHTGKSVLLLQPTADWRQFVLAGRPFDLPQSALKWDSYLAGPQLSLGWTGPNDLSASWAQPVMGQRDGHQFEFVNLHVDALGVMTITYYYDLDWDAHSYPNGIAQCNGPRCNEPPPTATPTSPPTATATATHTPTVTPTPTQGPCVPRTQNSDIVLLVDVSSSMIGQKFKDAQGAAREFATLVDMPTNRMAVVSFAETVGLHQMLTGDRNSVIRAIDNLTVRSGTRIDLGLEAAESELNSTRHLADHAKVVVMLTDGIQVPAGPLAVAARLRSEGILVFVIGLGTDVNRTLLEQLAWSPAHYYSAVTSHELTDIYRRIAVAIPCNTPTPTP